MSFYSKAAAVARSWVWGGTGERWDKLRHRIQSLLREPDGRLEQELLAFRGTTTIQARGRELSVQLDSSGRLGLGIRSAGAL